MRYFRRFCVFNLVEFFVKYFDILFMCVSRSERGENRSLFGKRKKEFLYLYYIKEVWV